MPAPRVPATISGSNWATVGEYSVGQFHAAKKILGRYNIPCRVGHSSSDSPNMILEVPRAAHTWASSLLAAAGYGIG
jgi:hypothetical protein